MATTGTSSSSSVPGPSVSPMEAIALMQKGSTLLKCGRTGKPHFRTFTLEEDFHTLNWTSPIKNPKDSSVDLNTVTELVLGQKTPVFLKNRFPEYEQVSFSLVYEDRSLDIICKTKEEYDIWVTGIKSILEGTNLTNPEEVVLQERPQSDRISVMFRGNQTIVCKVEDSNDLYSWGQGQSGRLGHGNEEDQLLPKVVETLLGKDIRAIACGPSHTGCISADRELYTFGAASFGRLGHGHERERFLPSIVSALKGVKVVQVACGDFHTAALIDCGVVFSWGKGDDGRLGHGGDTTFHSPTQIEALNPYNVVYIACGFVSTAVITDDGSLLMFGGNEKGQLGMGDKLPRLLPTKVETLAETQIYQVACASWHTVAITHEGEIFTWGNGANGKLGHDDEEDQILPRKVDIDCIARQVSCGDFHSVILSDRGEVYSWGEGNYGQLGHNALTQFNKPLKVKMDGKIVIQISCGANHTAALTDNGQLFTWGYGLNGRLGLGDEKDQRTPKLVMSMMGKKVKQVACGGSHTACTIAHGWVPDEEANECMACKKQFTFVNRRHHCRNCGGVFCGKCSSKRVPLLKDGLDKPVRVCNKCYTTIIKSNV